MLSYFRVPSDVVSGATPAAASAGAGPRHGQFLGSHIAHRLPCGGWVCGGWALVRTGPTEAIAGIGEPHRNAR